MTNTDTAIRFMAARSTTAQIESALAEMADGSVRVVALEVFDHPLAVDTDGKFGAGPGKLGHVVMGPPERVRAWLVEGGFDDYDEVAEAGVPDLTPLDSAGSVPDMTNTEVDEYARIHAAIRDRAKLDLSDVERLLDQGRVEAAKAIQRGGRTVVAGLARLSVRVELARLLYTEGLASAVAAAMRFRDGMIDTTTVEGLALDRAEASAARSWLRMWEDEIIEVLPHLGPETRRRILSDLISGV